MPRQSSPVPGLLLAALLALPLPGCSGGSSSKGPDITVAGTAEPGGFLGGVVSDEPQASLIGRAALAAGGTAADAAAAMYFALAVTYPNAASLGGGGVCVVYPPGGKSAQVLDFRAGTPAVPGPVAAPGNVRGFAALQARYGHLRWSRILAPAERLARFGFPMSHATAEMLETLSPAARARIPGFLRDAGGRPLREGATVHEPALSGTLDRLRTAGIGDLYTGDLAHRFLAASSASGGTLTLGDLMHTVARWREPAIVSFGDLSLMLPPDDPGSRIFTSLWQAAVSAPGMLGLSGGGIAPDKLVAAMGAAYATAGGSLPIGGAGSTGLVALDAYGEAVACTLTMGQAFGTGRIAGDTGILLAAAPGGKADESRFLVPVVAANLTTHQAVAAMAGSGGAVAPAVEVQVLGAALAEEKTAAAALSAPRYFRAGPRALVLHEAGIEAPVRAAIGVEGTKSMEVSKLGEVNLGLCPKGLASTPQSCRFRADPRGFGLAAGSTP